MVEALAAVVLLLRLAHQRALLQAHLVVMALHLRSLLAQFQHPLPLHRRARSLLVLRALSPLAQKRLQQSTLRQHLRQLGLKVLSLQARSPERPRARSLPELLPRATRQDLRQLGLRVLNLQAQSPERPKVRSLPARSLALLLLGLRELSLLVPCLASALRRRLVAFRL